MCNTLTNGIFTRWRNKSKTRRGNNDSEDDDSEEDDDKNVDFDKDVDFLFDLFKEKTRHIKKV